MVLKKKKLMMSREASRWVLGLFYLFAVALIWVASNFIVQSVISGGASPFLITYICNSLFTLCIPIFEIYRYFEDSPLKLWFWGSSNEINSHMDKVSDSDEVPLLTNRNGLMLDEQDVDNQLDAKGRLTRIRTAKVSLLLCPFWFLAYLTFNLSLKYTTVTSITILSNTSSLFAFLLSLCFLGEKTAGLTIQVPMAAGIDAIRGRAPSLMDYLGALVIMAGFAGINIRESENENGVPIDESYDSLPVSKISARTT